MRWEQRVLFSQHREDWPEAPGKTAASAIRDEWTSEDFSDDGT